MGQSILPVADRVAPAAAPVASGAPSAAFSLLRVGLISGCAVAMGIAVLAGDPSGYLRADPDLARLLRGMALIKGMIVIGAVAAVFWRLAWPVSRSAAATYLVSSWALAGSTMLIWQLSHIVAAALVFHAAALSILWVSWRERRSG
jgi:hypothetical protein